MVVVGTDLEEDYVHWLKKVLDHTEIPIERITNWTGATDLVRAAVAHRTVARKDGNLYEIWCLVESRSDIDEARAMATKGGIKLVVSDPTLAVWLLMHFAEADGSSSQAIDLALRSHLPGLGSRSVDALASLMGRFEAAASRSRSSGDPPSSNMYELVDRLRQSLMGYLAAKELPKL